MARLHSEQVQRARKSGRAGPKPGDGPRARPHQRVTGPASFEFSIDRSWRIKSTTPKGVTWAGFAPDELVGVDRRDGATLKPPLFDAIAAAFESGAPSAVVFPSVLVPGRWVELRIDPRSDPARVRFRDVTSRILAKQSRSPPDDLGHPNLSVGPAEIVLLNSAGVIVSVNAAWRASLVAHAIKIANDGVGARYVDVCKAALPELDEVSFERELRQLLDGEVRQVEGTYTLETADGPELRHVHVTPLRIGRAIYFTAIHEDLTERARVLASLHETSDQLLRAQEEERKRIAVELHDSMSQHLAGLALGINNLRRRAAKSSAEAALLEDMAKLIQRAVQETRVLSYLMNASGQERDSLTTTVQRFVESFGVRAGLQTSVTADGLVDEASAAVRHAVFRVIQEALANVYRHARATTVTVSLVRRESTLTVRIADNGHGIAPAPGDDTGEAPLGVGIPGMRSRIEQLGGTLDITSDAAGAVVTATAPLFPRLRNARRAGERALTTSVRRR